MNKSTKTERHMKYMPSFDQQIVLDLDYKSQHGFLLDMIINASSWAVRLTEEDGDYYFLDYDAIISELPVIFKSKANITRVIKQLSADGVLSITKKGRSNFFKIIDEMRFFWGHAKDQDEYDNFIKSLKKTRIVQETEQSTIQKTERLKRGIVQETEQYRSGNGTIKGKIVQETEPTNTLSLSTTNNPLSCKAQQSLGFANSNPAQENNFEPESEATTFPAKPKPEPKEKGQSISTWEAYSLAYQQRYGVTPLRNGKVNGQLSALVQSVGRELAPQLASYYLTHQKGWYVQNRHPIDLLVRDVQAIYTDMVRNEQMTATKARQEDKTQNSRTVWQEVYEEMGASK